MRGLWVGVMFWVTACSVLNKPDDARPPEDDAAATTSGNGGNGTGGDGTGATGGAPTGVGGGGSGPVLGGKPGAGVVSAGRESASNKYRMVFTVGPESGAAAKTESPKYDKRGGVVGATQGK